MVEWVILQRSVYVRNTYQFTLGWEYCLLEPMDIVTLTDVRLGMDRIPVRITSIAEDDKGNLTVNAEEFPAGIATATQYPRQSRSASTRNSFDPPGPVNTPVIFEPSSDLAMGPPQVWVTVSGGVNWGGCTVHLSLDGTRFDPIGQIRTPARLGVLTAAIGAVADPDHTSTLSVSLAESPGATLVSGTQADADQSRTLVYVDGELMAYETATLTGVGQYGLSYLRRGLFGTEVAAHPVGGQFARIDGSQFAYELPPAYIGATLYLKFTSFNIYGPGVAEEDISTVAVYDYVPSGRGGYIAPPTNLLVSSTNRLAADGTAISTLIALWTASPGPLLAGYELDYRIHTVGGTNAWVSVQLGPDTTSWTLTPAVEGAVYDIQVRAISGLTPPTYSAFALPQNNAAVAYDTTVPAAPAGLQAVAGYQQVNVLWQANPSPSINAYELKAAQGAGATFAQAATIYKGPATQYLHAGFNAGSIWTYWVAAISRAGNEGPFSAPVLVNTPLGYDPSGILQNSITTSQLVEDLQKQIGSEGAAESVLADMVNQATEAMGTSSAIAQARQDAQSYSDGVAAAQAAITTSVLSQVQAAQAAIVVEAATRASADAASASLITQLQASVGGLNTASISQQLTALSNSASTQAQEITTLQTSASSASSAIQTIQNSLNGISAEYTIQTEVDVHGNRYIAGIGALANASGVSQVTVLANDFLIAGLNADGSLNPVSPFELVNGTVLMNKAVIGSITADQIAANTTYTGNLSIGNGQLLLHGADDGNGNGPYFIARDNNGTSRALVGRYGNEWGIWVWNAAGTNVLSADGLGTSVVGTTNAAQYAFSGMSAASTAAAQSIPVTETWTDVQTVAFTVVSGATGVAVTYSANLIDLYADANAPYGGGNNDAGGGNGGGGGDN